MNSDNRKMIGVKAARRGLAILMSLMLGFSVLAWNMPVAKAEEPLPTEESTPTPELTAEPTPEPTVEPTSTPEPTAEPTPEQTSTPEPTPQPTPVQTPEPISESFPQSEGMIDTMDVESFAMGDGTETSPYGISTPEQLNAVRNYPEAHFILAVTSVTLSSDAETLIVGNSKTLSTTVLLNNATYPEVTWSSDNESVATVDQNGRVTAKSPGTVSITATADGVSDTCEVAVVPAGIQSPKYIIDKPDGLMKGVAGGTTVLALKPHLGNDGGLIKVYSADGQEVTGGIVGTGMTVQYSVNGVLKDSLGIVVTGDISGDGITSVADYTQLRVDILGLKHLSGLYAAAGDVNNDGKRDISDYTLIRLDILGIRTIN